MVGHGPACWISAMLSRTQDEQGPFFVSVAMKIRELLGSRKKGKQFSCNWCCEAYQKAFTFRTVSTKKWQVLKSSHTMQSYSSITNCCDMVLFTPKHCLSYLWFKAHVYVCVCIYQSICLNQIFLLSLRILWFTWSQPVPQPWGECWVATAELQLSWRCSFSSLGSGYFHRKAKCFRNWRDAVRRCVGEANTCIADIFFWSMETVLILSSLQWSTETLSPKACSLPGQPNKVFCLFYLYS